MKYNILCRIFASNPNSKVLGIFVHNLIHASQKELESTEEYADFEYSLRPTFDFKQELLAQGDEVEVLEPVEFRQEMKDIVQQMVKRYS